MARRRLTLRFLKEQCATIEEHVLHRELATAEEVAEYRPGGDGNRRRDLGAWIRFYAQLTRFAGREERREATDDEAWRADAKILDALRAEPLEVTLTARTDDGELQTITVYPKGLDALLTCHAKNWLIGWLTERLTVLNERNRAEDAALIERTLQELSYQYGLLVWIVTHPGPQMPYDPRREDPDVPERLGHLEPWDYIRICQGLQYVNAQRLEGLEILVREEPTGKKDAIRPSWSVFIGAMSVKMKLTPHQLMRDVSLGELLAGMRVAAPPSLEEQVTDG